MNIHTKLAAAQELLSTIGEKPVIANNVSTAPVPDVSLQEEQNDLGTLEGVGEKTVAALVDAGFKTINDLKKATVEQLTRVKGIGEKKAEKIITQARGRIARSE